MATIHINRGGTNLGTFSEDDVRAGLLSGRFLGTDLCWREGMPSWQPLSQLPEFVSDATAAPPSPSSPEATEPIPAAPPPVAPTAAVATTATVARTGLPWEHRQNLTLLSAFVDTVRLVLTNPGQAFAMMKTEGGFTDPLLFALIGGSIGAIVWTLLSLMINSLGLFAAMTNRDAFGGMMGFGLGGMFIVVRIILIPIFIVVGLFIWAAIVHGCLMLVGGARKSFETSFRALSFAYGATSLFLILPCCGRIIGPIWGMVAGSIGLARAHETDTGRGVLAVILPLVLCCGGGLLLAMLFGGLGALMQHANH